MHVTKRIDLSLLATELAAAGVAHNALGLAGTDADGELFTFTAPTDGTVGERIELPPEAAPVVDAHDGSAPQRTKAFEAQEDAERAALVAERALTDPAFAALADLTLGKQGG